MEQQKRINNIMKAVHNDYYNNLGVVEISDASSIEQVIIEVTPHEGFHKEKKYFITLKFEDDEWPRVFIDSVIFDKIKTNQYLNNQGKVGNHKGVCIKNLSYGYAFRKYFKNLCDNKWENYVYYIITLFNNFQEDFESGNGIRRNYKELLLVN